MNDFLAYLKNHPAKRRITGIVTIKPSTPPPGGLGESYCELAKRPLIEWLLHHDGKIHHRMPGTLQLRLYGPYEEFWKKLVVKEFPSMTLEFNIPPK